MFLFKIYILCEFYNDDSEDYKTQTPYTLNNIKDTALIYIDVSDLR